MKALLLFSGGLDSLLAAKLLLEQGIEVEGVHFLNPFSTLSPKKVEGIAAQLPLKLHILPLRKDYLSLIENPKHGYGKRMNPCLDCRIFHFKKAWKLAQEIGAHLLVTGEVVGQRPFSQRKEAMMLIEKEAGLQGKILRPLSARLLPETEAEKKGEVERSKLLDIQGRGRKRQLELAEKYGFGEFLTPAGGCLLTDPAFSKRLREFFDHGGKPALPLVELLKLGRHFRIGPPSPRLRGVKVKVVVGREEEENRKLKNLAKKEGWIFGRVLGFPSPTAVIPGRVNNKILKEASKLAAHYSDAPEGEEVSVRWADKVKKQISVLVPKKEEVSQPL